MFKLLDKVCDTVWGKGTLKQYWSKETAEFCGCPSITGQVERMPVVASKDFSGCTGVMSRDNEQWDDVPDYMFYLSKLCG